MIRKFKIEDLDKIMEIWLNSNIEAHPFIDKKYWEENYSMVRDILPTSIIYIYEEGEKILGFVGMVGNYIAGIFVDREFRSKGIGKCLLKYCKERNGVLKLNVYVKNIRAIDFYRREGFVIEDEKVDNVTQEKEYIMIFKKI